jgi:hypothetical protein
MTLHRNLKRLVTPGGQALSCRRATLAAAFLLLLPWAALAAAPDLAKDTEVKVRLTAPVSTATNQKGDKITAMVVDPAPFRGAVMEGEIRESKSGNKFKGKSTLLFAFQTLVLPDGTQVPVTSDVKSFTNSKGQQNTDEEGFLVEKKNNLGKMAVASGVGALIGGLAAGGKGAAIGAGVGAGAALILVQFGAQAPNIRLDPGSEIVLNVSPRRENKQ